MLAIKIIEAMSEEKRCSICNNLVAPENISEYVQKAYKAKGITISKHYYPMFCKACTKMSNVFE